MIFSNLTRRLLSLLGTWCVIIVITFFLMRVAPGSPFGTEEIFLTPEVEAQLNAAYGLDNPWYIQFKDYFLQILQGDLGRSMKYADRRTTDIIRDSFPISLQLTTQSLALALGLGTVFGIYGAAKEGGWLSQTLILSTLLMISVPSFIVASLLQYVFGLKLGWLPISGWHLLGASILPSLALGSTYAGNISRLVRSNALVESRQAYVDLAKAKGLSQSRILFAHILRNAYRPILAYLGPCVSGLLIGGFVVENLFAIPGLGTHLVNSIHHRDYPVIMGLTIFYSLVLLLSVLASDLLMGYFYPWMFKEEAEHESL